MSEKLCSKSEYVTITKKTINLFPRNIIWTCRKRFRQSFLEIFCRKSEKISVKVKEMKRSISKMVFFSSKCSSEHVKCRFDNFEKIFMPNVRKLPKIRLRIKKKKVLKNISFHQSVRLQTWKAVLTICRIDFVKTQKKF